MNAPFGIDHPLVAVNDIEQLRERLIAIGFNMTSIGKHPWGTSTSLAMFEGSLIEIMGIYDESKIDELPTGNFHFGRHVYEHLMRREGVALTALHSTDSQRDALRAKDAGFTTAGHLEFGRDVTLPDGRQDRTKTTLALMPDTRWPRLSLFLCQQHRPELVYVHEWLEHPNSVHGIDGIIIWAELDDQRALVEKFSALYGTAIVIAGGYQLETANGYIRILTSQSIELDLGVLPDAVLADDQPCIVGIDLLYADSLLLMKHLQGSGIKFSEKDGVLSLLHAQDVGNIFLRFHERAHIKSADGNQD